MGITGSNDAVDGARFLLASHYPHRQLGGAAHAAPAHGQHLGFQLLRIVYYLARGAQM
jgi:hypothetical protein